MLARCPSCEKPFAVVGRCRTACPFCAATLDVKIVRQPTSPHHVEVHLVHPGPRRIDRDSSLGYERDRGLVEGQSTGDLRAEGAMAARQAVATPAHPVNVEAMLREAAESATEAFAEARMDARVMARLRSRPFRLTAWERAGGWWPGRWLRTMRAVLFSPRRFFRVLSAERWGGALSFAAIQLAIASVSAMLAVGRGAPVFSPAHLFTAFGAALAALTVVFVLLLASFHATTQTLLRRRVRWAGVGRVSAFGLAPLVFTPIPYVGWPLAVTWMSVLHALGLSRMLGMPLAVGVLTSALPWLSFFIVIVWSL